MRQLKNPLIAESFILTILAAVLFYFVSLSSALANMLASEHSYAYFINAFSEAELFVQFVLLSVGVIGLLFVRDIVSYFPGFRRRLGFI
ncbi:MAG: hypothetical protein HYX23_00800 [Candidatus Zambryskibacteria bacterium]|nr:hypothetical protein [Candidatus Zambryskibacteria bacterium]